ncbi:MAG: lysophospholipid acyltransferase family protein [Bacilli bacterium]|nr:lysophospholipid acyltransferase family protein [Bacilli bacterium]
MKIIYDTDGTTTDFNAFIEKVALPYFKKKYGMEVVNPKALEAEDILDMHNFFIKESGNSIEALNKQKKALDKFWIGPNFVKFSLLSRFRPGVRKHINQNRKDGNDVEIHTSRAKTCNKNFIGFIARTFTILQYAVNGVPLSPKNFYFYKNDEEKVRGIISAKPDLVFDDKPSIIKTLSEEKIKTICVKGKHNDEVANSENVEIIKSFDEKTIEKAKNNLIGIKNLKLYDRINKSDRFFQKLKVFRPIIMHKFNPIILHEENMASSENEVGIYAPNHRSTLDPMVITAILVKNIHWAALKRFFDGRDSIFANSKNSLLCRITANSFKKMHYFPIERKCDNEEANNFVSIKDMNNFLKLKQTIGIFSEGTTRRPDGEDFGTFDSSFLLLAKRNGTIVRPVTSLWAKKEKLKNKVIVNFGEPFYVEKDMPIDDAMNKFRKIQIESLKENREHLKMLVEESAQKKLIKR